MTSTNFLVVFKLLAEISWTDAMNQGSNLCAGGFVTLAMACPLVSISIMSPAKRSAKPQTERKEGSNGFALAPRCQAEVPAAASNLIDTLVQGHCSVAASRRLQKARTHAVSHRKSMKKCNE